MSASSAYSGTYEEARARFRDAARAASANLERHQIDFPQGNSEPLTIDVASLGPRNPSRAVVVSSGVHGIEGFFGSAVQLEWLNALVAGGTILKQDTAVILIHGVNPYGFSNLRRVNEDNADLNRNFLSAPADYSGAPKGYAELGGFLNPSSPPSPVEPVRLKILWYISRSGFAVLKNVVAGGQYEFEKGLFYGGKGPSKSAQIIQGNFGRWTAGARDVIHIDVHSGLGKYGEYRLMTFEPPESPDFAWYQQLFGADFVEPLANAQGTAYRASGSMGAWLARNLDRARYRFVASEFGTYSAIRVLAALRAENRAHFYAEPSDPAYQRAKAELAECFCPRSEQWRELVVSHALRIIGRAMESS